ncbi:MAG: glutaredoxin family protein [Cyanobacteria bacterium J06627_8]
MGSPVRLILFSKPGCHLCEGLQEKLESMTSMDIVLEIRDITTRTDWFQYFQYEIPVLFYVPEGHQDSPEKVSDSGDGREASPSPIEPIRVERASPRAPVHQVEKLIRRAIAKAE